MDEPGPSLRARAVAGTRWTAASAIAIAAIQFAQVAVLSQLLTPRDFGLMAIVLVVTGLAQAFGDGGLNGAIMVRRIADAPTLSTLYWTNVGFGVAVALLIVVVSPLVAGFYRAGELQGLLAVCSLAFVFNAFSAQFRVLLHRDLRYETLARIDTLAAATGFVVAVVAAALDAGAYAPALAYLVNSLTGAAQLVAVAGRRWRPRRHWRRAELSRVLDFGLMTTGSQVLNFLTSNIDYILIGRVLGPSALGIYVIAFQLIIAPVMRINPIVIRVILPLFVRRAADPEALRRALLEVTRMLATPAFPLLTGLAVAAPQLVPVLFGDRWQESIPVVQVLAAVGLGFMVVNPVGVVVTVRDRVDAALKQSIANLVVLAGAFLVVVGYGVLAVAWAWLGVNIAMSIGTYLILRHVVEISPRRYLASMRIPALLSVPMGLVMFAIGALGADAGLGHGALLAIEAVAGLTVYLGLSWVVQRDYLQTLAATARAR